MTRVSIASRPKSGPEPPEPADRVYASSMNSTPPSACWNTSVVLIAVPPMIEATRSARATSVRCPLRSTPSSARMAP